MTELPGLGLEPERGLSGLGLEPESEPEHRGPSRLWIYLGSVITAAAVAFSIWWIVSGIVTLTDKIDSFQRVDVPGSGSVQLQRGDGTIYYEGERANITVRVVEVATGKPVHLSNTDGSSEYSFGDHSGVSVFDFSAPTTGKYDVNVTSNVSGGQLAVGEGIAGDLFSTLGIGLGAFFIVGAFGVFLIVFTVVRRRKSAALNHQASS